MTSDCFYLHLAYRASVVGFNFIPTYLPMHIVLVQKVTSVLLNLLASLQVSHHDLLMTSTSGRRGLESKITSGVSRYAWSAPKMELDKEENCRYLLHDKSLVYESHHLLPFHSLPTSATIEVGLFQRPDPTFETTCSQSRRALLPS